MANSVKGVVDIFLGNADRMIKFNYNAICDLEDFFKRPAHKIFDSEDGTVGMSTIRGCLYIGLQKHHKGVTVEEVGDWLQETIEEGRYTEVAAAVGQAFTLALTGPEFQKPDSKNPEPSTPGAKKGKKGKKASTSPRSSKEPVDSE